ncbi:nucleotidyltransferase family protein [Microvirga guangxiensis]|uniref:Predicted nucleotidyltransferase n=1 Tax=Microvirga guangxiensis TaxID=549386 RepID=A0A1G5HSK6_9HYPH|nr:nucleotidyltransferase domain-containing protein [Microvirga guangxiensis]SCY66270.1 Predicted nucleotidyltransferase [Microvirga guangxiensis]
MKYEATILQNAVLKEAAAFGEKFQSLKTIAIFGSVARGEENPNSDIDIAFEWLKVEEIATKGLLADFQKAQAELEVWKSYLEQQFSRPVSLHLDHPYQLQKDAAEEAILAAIAASPLKIGKAVLAPTASVKSSGAQMLRPLLK